MKFEDLKLIPPILKAVKEKGYTSPTPIQAQAIPAILEHRDLLGCAQTGTGKTAAFAIPTLQTLHEAREAKDWPKGIKALIITPTRELAIQIDESFSEYGKGMNMSHAVIFGGVKQHSQTRALAKGVDILVATPGRLLDLMNQGHVRLNDLKIFTLDEADRMLDMGFINDVKKVIKQLPAKRQTLFFSATMPPVIAKLAHSLLHNPVKVEVAPVSSTAESITQRLFYTDKGNKKHLLLYVLADDVMDSVLVFTRTKHGANKLVTFLGKSGVHAAAIHGNKSQAARQKALSDFKAGKIRVLVATDIAARGIDINELSFVVNYDIPNEPESYVHRIGRTGRAQNTGIAFSFCDRDEQKYIRDIQRLIKKDIPVAEGHPYPFSETNRPTVEKSDKKPFLGRKKNPSHKHAKPWNKKGKRY